MAYDTLAQLPADQAELLARAPVGRLATADSNGVPHVIPVCYAVMDGMIYSVLDQKPKRATLTRLRRVQNILANPQVSLVVDHYEENWERLWYILISGHAKLLEEGAERPAAIRVLRAKYAQYRTMNIAPNPMIKITPSHVVSWGFRA
jgi:PPOX class probable F420-dependent enzyme